MPEPWQTLAYLNAHPRDKEVRFVEKTHTYFVKGSSKGIVSTTGFVHSFFPHFEPLVAIKAMKKSPKWPQHALYGKTDQEIIDTWAASGKEASGLGTAMHLSIEQFLNGAVNRIDPSVKETLEWKYFMNFHNDHQDLEPYRTEWEVWDEEHKITGSIDMIYRNKIDGTFAIYDWKRANKMETESKYNNSGIGPAKHLPDTNYWHYTIQLNLYRWFLEKHYGLKISEMALVVLHPDNKNYKCYKLNRLDDEVEEILAARLRAVKEGKGKIYIFDEEAAEESCEEELKFTGMMISD